jgi:hypothetical protein
VSLPHSKSNGGPSDGQNRGKTNPSTWKELESGPDRIGRQDQDLVCDRIWVLDVLVLIPVGSRNRISELLIEKCVIGLYLLYTSQNLFGTIFRVTFAMLYRRIWSIVGNYSILCCDSSALEEPPHLPVHFVIDRVLCLYRRLRRRTQGQTLHRWGKGSVTSAPPRR